MDENPRLEKVLRLLDADPGNERLKRDVVLASICWPPFAILDEAEAAALAGAITSAGEALTAAKAAELQQAIRAARLDSFSVACAMRGVFSDESLAELIAGFDVETAREATAELRRHRGEDNYLLSDSPEPRAPNLSSLILRAAFDPLRKFGSQFSMTGVDPKQPSALRCFLLGWSDSMTLSPLRWWPRHS